MSSVPIKPSDTDARAAHTTGKAEAKMEEVDNAATAALDPAVQARLVATRAERQAARRAERETQQKAAANPIAKAEATRPAPVLKSVPASLPPTAAMRALPPSVGDPAPIAIPMLPAASSPTALTHVKSVAAAPDVIPPRLPQPVPEAAVRPTANLARFRSRHRMLLLSFALLVLLPIAVTAFYLWERAVDQYASTVGFSVRREEVSSAMDLLGGISALSKSSSSDTDILYEFLKSQKLVADLDAELDLRAMWSKPEDDPVYRFDSNGSIEDLVDYWAKMVRIYYDSSSGLIEVRVLAFAAEDATQIAQAVLAQSSEMINGLSMIAREDAISYSREELQTAQDRLKDARKAVSLFRNQHQIVDPATDLQTHAGVLSALQSELTAAQVELDLLSESAQINDPRLAQAKRRIEVIEVRIAAERSKVGMGADGQIGDAYASVVGDYERLSADLEFAQQSYVAALASYDGALAEARRKSRYLAAHILPTKAEVSRYPERGMILGMISLFLFLTWAIGALVTYSLRDRR